MLVDCEGHSPLAGGGWCTGNIPISYTIRGGAYRPIVGGQGWEGSIKQIKHLRLEGGHGFSGSFSPKCGAKADEQTLWDSKLPSQENVPLLGMGAPGEGLGEWTPSSTPRKV